MTDRGKEGKYDPGHVLKKSYRESEKAIDVIVNGTSFVPAKFDDVEITRNSDCLITKSEYYTNSVKQITRILPTADVSGSLNNKFFFIYAGRDYIKYVVWFNVDGAGTAPILPDTTSIEITLVSDDNLLIVATAIKLALNNLTEFTATLLGNEIIVTNTVGGVTTDAEDIDSGFTITTDTDGARTLVATILLTYSSSNKLIGVERR